MKNTIKLIGIIAIVAVIGHFIACDNDGGNGNPCSGGHMPGNAATCTTPQTCTVCSATITAALGHDYSVFVSTTADCLTAGLDTYKCSRCTSTEERARAALGHTGTWLITTYPTELADGEETGTCDNCNATTRPLTKATYQTYFYGTWEGTGSNQSLYTIEITANTLNVDSSISQQITNLTWEIITNPVDTYISDFPSGYKLDGDKVGSQNARFIAIDNDGRLLFNVNANISVVTEAICTRVTD